MDDKVILTENKLASLFAAATLGALSAHGAGSGHISHHDVKPHYITDKILNAIADKETSGKKGVKKLDINKKWSYGDYQIQQQYLNDANEEMGTHYTVEQVQHNTAIAKKVVRAYLTKWIREFQKTTGKKPTLKHVIAMHQGGGPGGWHSEHSLAYAEDILKRIK